MNWRELPAGRELDRAVAQQRGIVVFVGDNSFLGVLTGDDNEPLQMTTLPAYSTDVNAALGLLATADHWGLDYHTVYGINKRRGYSVHINGRSLCEFADAPALAIVRAWLSWMDTLPAQTDR